MVNERLGNHRRERAKIVSNITYYTRTLPASRCFLDDNIVTDEGIRVVTANTTLIDLET